jgi:hypothetical protein
MHHGTPMVHSPSSSNQASSQDDVPPNTKSEAPKAEGFNMLIAAATSESMNSIDEEEKVTQQVVVTTAAKGILKHPRGKQLVSPLESEEKAEKEADADVAIEQRDDKEKEETQSSSAGPLKKRRKMEEQSVAADDVIVFLERLHKFLTDESPDVSRAMEWLSHGKGFRVLRWDVLAEKVLPELMNGKEELDADALIHSFKGQLKECGFVEVKRGKDYGSYCLEVSSSCSCDSTHSHVYVSLCSGLVCFAIFTTVLHQGSARPNQENNTQQQPSRPLAKL